MSGLRQLQPHELSYLGLIGTTSRRDQSSAIHSRILMVHAGRHREGQGYRMVLGRWVRRRGGCRHAGARSRARGDTWHRDLLIMAPVGGYTNGLWRGKKPGRAAKRRHVRRLYRRLRILDMFCSYRSSDWPIYRRHVLGFQISMRWYKPTRMIS